MTSQPSGGSLIAGALAAILLVLPAAAQNSQSTPSGNPAPAITNTAVAKPVAVADKAPASGVADVLKMLEAGVSKDVLQTYVENSTVVYNLTSADVIALKEHGVSDDITVILLKRSAETRAQIAQIISAQTAAATNALAHARAVRYMNSANVDPESEDYFQYYYLYPRTLAYSYQTLGYPTAPYGYGYYGYNPSVSYGYSPFFGSGFGPRRFRHP